jgi:hypothetical protein
MVTGPEDRGLNVLSPQSENSESLNDWPAARSDSVRLPRHGGSVYAQRPSDRPPPRSSRIGRSSQLHYSVCPIQSGLNRPEPGRVQIDSVVIFDTRAERATFRTCGRRAPSRI